MSPKKQLKVTNEDLLKAINGGFNNVQEQLDDVRQRMTTKEDLEKLEIKLTNKIDAVQESVNILEEVDVLDLQKRVQKNEKEIRTLNRHVFHKTT
ncbi:MAG: hypothetical protein A3A33_02005 [Candidatus Yanofskybacteria bacterium RIFCSPLOWO2_01_FULL_49_25]|uniref:Uncharacterized protein n=1 Tax=Candidatus Yanofskybacteria bacterium RIFCSPLOWO2_01_FULL_49_25 TaxID=1802701 RepID=A0A1F8GUM7_9BACT|nr:MAG: hypothetical protein A3A33_02005 [Candidatus Yanofskybacteria bacterium RIFCSPLOWO2_01_FULL_49_25]